MCKCCAFKGAPDSNYKTGDVGGDASLLTLNFYVLLLASFVFPIFSVFKVVYREYGRYPFAVSVMSVMP